MEPSTRPSRASLREVKREARERKKAHRRMQQQWGTAPPLSRRLAGPLSWLGTTAVLALAAFLLLGPERLGLTGGDDEGADDLAVEEPAASAAPADPYAGTDVATWKSGAAAVAAPKARRVGAYTDAQVAAAYDRAKAYVLAANVDPEVLYQGTVDPVRATINGQAAANLTGLVAHPSQSMPPAGYVTRFRPGVVPLAEPRGQVRLRAAAVEEDGEPQLAVSVASVFVYALRSAEDADSRKLVTVRREITLEFTPKGKDAGKPYLGASNFLSTGEVCGEPPQRLGFLSVYFGDQPLGDGGRAPSYDVKDLDAVAPDADCFRDSSA